MSVIITDADINTLQDYNIDEIQKQIILWKDAEKQGNDLILLGMNMVKEYKELIKMGNRELEHRQMVKDINEMKIRLVVAEEELQRLLSSPSHLKKKSQMSMPEQVPQKSDKFWTFVGGEYIVTTSQNEVYDTNRNRVGKWEPDANTITIDKDEYFVTKSHCIFNMEQKFVGRWTATYTDIEEKGDFIKMLVGNGEYGSGMGSVPSKLSRASTRYT